LVQEVGPSGSSRIALASAPLLHSSGSSRQLAFGQDSSQPAKARRAKFAHPDHKLDHRFLTKTVRKAFVEHHVDRTVIVPARFCAR
jgi:hypothetical protein